MSKNVKTDGKYSPVRPSSAVKQLNELLTVSVWREWRDRR